MNRQPQQPYHAYSDRHLQPTSDPRIGTTLFNRNESHFRLSGFRPNGNNLCQTKQQTALRTQRTTRVSETTQVRLQRMIER